MDFTFEIESTDAEGIEAIRGLAEVKTTVLEGPDVVYSVAWSGHHEERWMFESFATTLGQIQIDLGLLEHGRAFAAEVAAAIPAELLVKLIVETFGRSRAPKPASTSPEGATVEEVRAATGWQPHTVRGVFSGALKKKLGLAVVAAKEERGRVYRITQASA
jgi:hypothetical protein